MNAAARSPAMNQRFIAGEQRAGFNRKSDETKTGNPDHRENDCAPVGGEEGNVAEGEQAAEGYHHREGIHSVPIEDYMVYSRTFSGAREPEISALNLLFKGRLP
jgi:hypothetical protein